LTPDSISKLRFRELKRELQARSLTLEGTTGQLRVRLRQAVGLPDPECIVNEDGIEDDCQTVRSPAWLWYHPNASFDRFRPDLAHTVSLFGCGTNIVRMRRNTKWPVSSRFATSRIRNTKSKN
jgi:hypothetical protein